MSQKITDDLFDAIDLIVSDKVEKLNYDKTEQCSILQDRGNGEYYVSNGVVKYLAYAKDDAKYKQGDSVFVTIPQNNYDDQKIIAGKYSLKDDFSLESLAIADQFVNITDNVCLQTGKITTKDTVKMKQDSFSDFNRLYLKGDFSTSLESLTVEGSYGLVLRGRIQDSHFEKELNDIEEKMKDGDSNLEKEISNIYNKYHIKEGAEERVFEVSLDVSDMLGNPYAFDTPIIQEKMFTIEPTSTISELKLYFYVNDDFKTFTGENVSDISSKIAVENVEVGFGYSLDSYSTDTVFLSSLDGSRVSSQDSQKQIKLNWVHFDEDGKPHSITSLEDDVLKYHFAEVEWYCKNNSLTPEGWEKFSPDTAFFTTTKINENYLETRFKAIVYFDDKKYQTSDLVFSSNGVVQNGQIYATLSLDFEDSNKWQGDYRCFDGDSLTLKSSSFIGSQKLKVNYASLSPENQWKGEVIIHWKIPVKNTMIKSYEEIKPEEGITVEILKHSATQGVTIGGYTVLPDSNYDQIIIKRPTFDDGTGTTLTFNIKDILDFTATNNTIKCKVYDIASNASLSIEKALFFNTATICGTPYSIFIDWTETAKVNNNTVFYNRPSAITWGETSLWEFDVKVFDENQESVAINAISTSWYNTFDRGYKYSPDKYYKIFTQDRKCYLEVSDPENVLDAYFSVLEFEISIGTQTLIKRMPIPVRKYRSCTELKGGADRIYYNSAGLYPTYAKSSYQVNNSVVNNDTKEWAIVVAGKDGIFYNDSKVDGTASPILKIEKNYNYPMFTTDISLEPPWGYDFNTPIAVVCFSGTQRNERVWVQPLLIQNNQYEYSFLNEWDGSTKIDVNNDMILTAMLGVGKKSNENLFSGVVIGGLSAKKENGIPQETQGIYGFNEGIQTFKFLTDGTAQIGTEDSNCVKFHLESSQEEVKKRIIEVNGKINASSGDIGGWMLESSSVKLPTVSGNNEDKDYSIKILNGGNQRAHCALRALPRHDLFYDAYIDDNNSEWEKLKSSTDAIYIGCWDILQSSDSSGRKPQEVATFSVKYNGDVHCGKLTYNTQSVSSKSPGTIVDVDSGTVLAAFKDDGTLPLSRRSRNRMNAQSSYMKGLIIGDNGLYSGGDAEISGDAIVEGSLVTNELISEEAIIGAEYQVLDSDGSIKAGISTVIPIITEVKETENGTICKKQKLIFSKGLLTEVSEVEEFTIK